MYAERYAPQRVNRGSLSLSVAMVGTLVGAAMLSSPVVRHVIADPPIHIYTVPPVTPPPPEPQPRPLPEQKTRPTPPIDRPIPLVPTEPEHPLILPPEGPPPIDPGTLDGTGDGTGAGTVAIDPPKPPPVLTQVGIDERYLRDFQPVYPAAERRAGNEGAVIVRVLVGVDGRVRQAIQLAAPSEAFWRATERQALTRWRFRPATRDGIPVEGWRTMTVRFKLEE